MITVRLPAMLRRPGMPAEVKIITPAGTIEALVRELDTRYPGLAGELDDSIFNFAVNDALVLQRARQKTLHAGDVVEVIPMISGSMDRDRTNPALGRNLESDGVLPCTRRSIRGLRHAVAVGRVRGHVETA